ncbi:MAG: hypothetical protein ACF8QF_07760 [Phycisphaerales bacterium]
MTVNDKCHRAWVSAAVQRLRDEGSWAGRIHVHKLLVVAQLLGLVRVPFRFELYRYGPYSFELDELIADMENFGFVSKEYAQPGYGPRLALSSTGEEDLDSLSEHELAALSTVASEFGRRGSKELELLATSLWVMEEEGVSDKDAVRVRVQELKPHRSESDTARGVDEALSLRETLRR